MTKKKPDRHLCKPIKHKIPDTREEWLQERQKGLGGSDAGAILGVNRYKSAYALWAEKTGLITPPDVDNEAMRQGRDLEDYVARRFSEETGKKVQKSSFSYQSSEHPWMLANIDRRIVGENAGLECKTASLFADPDYIEGEIPMSYYCQCLHYMAVMGFDRMYLAALVLGRNFHVFTIDRSDPNVQRDLEALVKAEEDFWRLVESHEPPEIDGSTSTKDSVMKLNPADPQEPDADIQDLEGLLDEREELKDSIEELKERIDLIENRCRAALGSSTRGFSCRYKIAYKPGTRTTFDSKSLKKDHPDIYSEYSTASETRALRITRKKERA